MTKPFYLTTPAYYVNGKPHVGHAYTTIACDVLARHARIRGRRTRLLTGTDEHGQKVERTAKADGLSARAFVDRLIPSFTGAWEALGITNDDFIRTTEPRHAKVVEEIWRRCEKNGDIYLGEYEGWYAQADEAYYTEKELVDGKAPTGASVERVKEPGYFFRLSKYAQPLLDYYEAHPDFVRPEGKFNEVKSFVRGEEGLRDLCISRTTFRWGLPVPGSPDHVIYVWFDALTNYVSALCDDGRIEGAELYETFWKHGEALHVIGKEITRFHCVYWPAFLMSAGLPLPRGIFAHGWMTVNGEKMSKSAGNFLPPEPLADALGKDALRYYLMRDVALGADSDFSHANMLARYHGDLGNGLGNLLNRLVGAAYFESGLGGRVPAIDDARLTDAERTVIETAERAARAASEHLEAIVPHRALESTWELVLAANKYIDQSAPWALAKHPAGSPEHARLEVVAYTVLESLRWLSVMLWPFMPEKCDGIRAQLGLPALMPTEGLDRWPSAWGGLPGGTRCKPGAPLFPRLDEDQQRAYYERLGVTPPGALAKKDAPAKPVKEKKPSEPKPAAEAKAPSIPGVITIDDLDKVEMRLALVKSAERVPKSDKLLELKVDLGEPELRTILAGIGEHYAPEALVGRRIAVVANLAPRTFAKFGKTSHGMVLAVSDAGGLSVLSPDKEISQGVRLK